MNIAEQTLITTGQAAKLLTTELGVLVPRWACLRIFEKNLLREAGRAGSYRLISRDQLPALRDLLISEGHVHLPAEREHAIAG